MRGGEREREIELMVDCASAIKVLGGNRARGCD